MCVTFLLPSGIKGLKHDNDLALVIFPHCDALYFLVPFVQQLLKCEKHSWRSITFSTESNNRPWVFSRFLNCSNGTKLRKASHI